MARSPDTEPIGNACSTSGSGGAPRRTFGTTDHNIGVISGDPGACEYLYRRLDPFKVSYVPVLVLSRLC